MKLYTAVGAPNPERVRMFIARKGLNIETHILSLRDAEQFAPEFRVLNPDCVVPALVLEDGTVIGESLAICRYLEALEPAPQLFGRTPAEVGVVEMWLRRLEIQGYLPTQDAYRNAHPAFAGRGLPGSEGDVEQIPALVARANHTMGKLLNKLDAQLGVQPFVAGDAFTMADIVLLTTLDFGRRTRFEVVQDLADWPNVAAWHQRRQAEASRQPTG